MIRSSRLEKALVIRDPLDQPFDSLGRSNARTPAKRRFRPAYISNENALVVQYDSWGDIKRYKGSFELSVYRIVQELLNNIIKHSRADRAIVQVSRHQDILCTTIEDNGIGRKGSEINKKSKEHKSMAMKITQDRIDNMSYKYRIQGSLEISDYDPQEGTGTRVVIFLPYRTEAQQV